jgi:hypothetical protein
VSYRVGTHADVCEFYGKVPRETLRVVAILLDERVVALIGLARTPSSMQLFSEYKPELSPYLSRVTVWRAVKRALRMVAECPCPVYVVSSDAPLMGRLGFQEVAQGIWRN